MDPWTTLGGGRGEGGEVVRGGVGVRHGEGEDAGVGRPCRVELAHDVHVVEHGLLQVVGRQRVTESSK